MEINSGGRSRVQVDTEIGPYQLLDVIGRGGMGVVYRARHRQSGSVVALKTVSEIDGVHLSALRSEIRTLARLRHPGVVQILDEGLASATPWFAMELLEGQPLSTRIDTLWGRERGGDKSTLVFQEGPGPAAGWPAAVDSDSRTRRSTIAVDRMGEAVQIVRKLCEALIYVHDQGIVHRDVKPSNVLLRAGDGAPVLIDFGLVSRFQAMSGRERVEAGVGSGAGTRPYMAPELLQREQVDARTDLYALGCLMFELFTGHLPSDQERFFHARIPEVTRSAPRPSDLVAGIPGWLDDLVHGLLARRPQERIGYAADVLECLEAQQPLDGRRSGRGQMATRRRSYLYRPRMAGRAAERAGLWSQIQATRSGNTNAAIYVGGESGCGKTSLVNALARQATLAGMTVVAGECRPIVGESTTVDPRDAPLHPFRPLLRTIADHCRSGGPASAKRILGPWAKLLARHEPALENVPGQEEMPDSPALNGEAARDRLLGALRESLLAFAAEKSLLLVLDDLQWADELSLAFLRSLPAAVVEGAPLVVLGTYRSDELSPDLKAIIDARAAVCVTLGRLDTDAVSSMAADMLGMVQAPPALVAFLLRVSEGNPFFVAEYLRAATAEGILVREWGQWHLPGLTDGSESAYDRLRLPRSISGLVSRRLAGLSQAARDLVTGAAILGRSGEVVVLAGMGNISPELLADPLTELVARQVLDVTADRYSFVHDKIREAAFEHIAEADRAALHRNAAEALERLSADPDAFQLASLYRTAGRADKAFYYARLAGRRALEAGAFRDARVHLQVALAIAEAQSGALPGVDAQERGQLRRLLGEALVVSGELRQGIEALHRACEELGLPVPAHTRAGWIVLALREILRWTLAAGWLRRWLLVTDQKQRALWITGSEVHRLVSMAYLFLVRPLECIGALLLSARLAEEAQANGQLAAARSFVAGICGLVGLRKLQGRLFATAQVAAEATQEVLPLLWHAGCEAVFLRYVNADWEGLARCTAPALARADENHLIYDRHPVEFGVAMGEFEQGKLGEALMKFERIHTRAESLGHQQYVVSARGALRVCDLYAGRFQRVVDASESDLALHASDKNVDLFIVLTCLAAAKLRLGDSSGANEMAARAWALVEAGAQLEGRPLAVRLLFDLADVMGLLWQEALIRREPHGPLARRAARVHRKLVRLARRNRYVQPGAILQQARRRAVAGNANESKILLVRTCDAARALDMPPFEAFARFELGRLPVSPDDERLVNVRRAVALFDQMGFAWHLDHALALERHIAGFQARKLA